MTSCNLYIYDTQDQSFTSVDLNIHLPQTPSFKLLDISNYNLGIFQYVQVLPNTLNIIDIQN